MHVEDRKSRKVHDRTNRQMMGQYKNDNNKKTKLKKVKWNGVALNIKRRLKLRYQKAFVNH